MKYKATVLMLAGLITLALASASFAEEGGHDSALLQNSWFQVTFVSAIDNGDGTSTWTYQVEEMGSGKDLSHWILALPDGAQVLSADPGAEVGKDRRTEIAHGIKWEIGDGFDSGLFSFTLQGVWAETTVSVGTKAGPGSDTADITGPSGNPWSDVDGSPSDEDPNDEDAPYIPPEEPSPCWDDTSEGGCTDGGGEAAPYPDS